LEKEVPETSIPDLDTTGGIEDNENLFLSSIIQKAINVKYKSVRAAKKIFWAVFAYEFELLHNRSFLVKSFAYTHGEIIYSVNCEI